jgi:hypothetical protein
MSGSFSQRRSGRDRRRDAKAGAGTQGRERRLEDRRQFPPLEDPDAVSLAARHVQAAVDQFKIEHGLPRISMDQLLGVLQQLGYRQA